MAGNHKPIESSADSSSSIGSSSIGSPAIGSSYIGIDVGGTKIMGVVVDPNTGEVSAHRKAPTPRAESSRTDLTGRTGDTARAIGDVVAGLIRDVEAHVPADAGVETPAIGVGVPGLVNHRGVLNYGPNVPGVLGLDIVSELRGRFGVPVVAENDGANAAIAEHRLGAARGHDHAVIITQGTGIGGAIIVGGQLVRGANGFAGEPGHMLIDPDGHTCACGNIGCWETVSSGAGLANIGRELIAEGRGARILELAGGDPAALRGEHVSTGLSEGDADAIEVLDRFASWVAKGIANLISLLDPGIVVLGGGLTEINQHFIDDVRERVMATVVGGPYRPAVPIVAAQLGPKAGAIGAAINAHDRFQP